MLWIVQITSGNDPGPYSIYYNEVNPSNVATLADPLSGPAVGLSLSQLQAGVGIIIPDNAYQLLIVNEECQYTITITLYPVTQPPTQTPKPSSPTPTPTLTPGLPPSGSPTPTPTLTPGLSPSPTPTPTLTSGLPPSQTPTPTLTSGLPPSQTPTPTLTSGLPPPQTPTPTLTPGLPPSETQTPTPTTTQTPTPSTTRCTTCIEFLSCYDNECVCDSEGINRFRFCGCIDDLPIDTVWYISGSTQFEGCATVVEYTGQGQLFDPTNVTFIEVFTCANSFCPPTPEVGAILASCVDGEIIYGAVNQNTAIPGLVYVLSGECYEFIGFGGPGGQYFGDPDFDDCESCKIPPSQPSRTPLPTPTPTPTVPFCDIPQYCFNTTLPPLSGYSGQFVFAGYYNNRQYYMGFGPLGGVIYFNGLSWCLSSVLGGECILEGATPCRSECPDISENLFTQGPCPTVPVPTNCDNFDFDAFFDCDWIPEPTPTPTIPCDDVDFEMTMLPPTPTPTTDYCSQVNLIFSLSSYTPDISVTPSVTPSKTPGNVNVEGQATFVMFEETFSCTSVKVLVDCDTSEELYVSDQLSLDGVLVTTGMTISVNINGYGRCMTYDRDDTNISSNSTVYEIFNIYGECGSCVPTQSMTPTPTSTVTPTITPTMTPTPSATNGTLPMVFVYESCEPINSKIVQVVQTIKLNFVTTTTQSFKDTSNNCWRYVGEFSSNYVAPPAINLINYSGNYFTGINETLYRNCSTCLTSSPPEPSNPPAGYGFEAGISNISIQDSCNNFTTNPTILYSNCDYQTLVTNGVGCYLYYDSSLVRPLNVEFVYIGQNYDVNAIRGQIIGVSFEQC